MEDNIDRNVTLFDEKQRILDLQSFNFEVPIVDIYDNPKRCYQANIQWAKIIEGFLDWLADVATWRDAENENFVAIQQIRKFMEGLDCMNEIDCTQIQACIESSITIIDIQNSLDNVGNNVSGGYDPTNFDKTFENGKYYQDSQTNAFTPENGCDDTDKDALWGAIDSLIDYIDAKNLDFLQQMSQAISLSDGAQKLIELTPLVELLPPANLTDLARWYLQYVVNGYLSEFTVDDKQEIKCALFCAIVETDCSLSLQDLINYIESEFAAVASANSIEDLLITLAGLISISGKEWFFAMTSLQLALAVMGEVFVRRDTIATYNKYIQAGALSPSGAWEIFCDECATPSEFWEIVLDFANDYVPVGDEIVLSNGQRYLRERVGNYRRINYQQYATGLNFLGANPQQVDYFIDFTANATVTQMRAMARRNGGFSTQRQTLQPVGFAKPFAQFGETIFVERGYAETLGESTNSVNFVYQAATSGQVTGIDMKYLIIKGTGFPPRLVIQS